MLILKACLIINFIYIYNFNFIRTRVITIENFFIFICFCFLFFTIIRLGILIENCVYVRGMSIPEILNPSTPQGSPPPPPPSGPPDYSTMGIITSNNVNNQEITPPVTNTGNNLSNTLVEAPQGITGCLKYIPHGGKHYIAFVNDGEGALITQFKNDNLNSCNLETITRLRFGSTRVLNLEGCIGVESHNEGHKEGVWMPDVRKAIDTIKDHKGCYLKQCNGKIFVYRTRYT